MSKDDNDNNVIHIVASNEDKTPAVPQYEYRVNYMDGNTSKAAGFLIFTTQHVAIMRDEGEGAVPVLVVPTSMVRSVEIVEDYPELPW